MEQEKTEYSTERVGLMLEAIEMACYQKLLECVKCGHFGDAGQVLDVMSKVGLI